MRLLFITLLGATSYCLYLFRLKNYGYGCDAESVRTPQKVFWL